MLKSEISKHESYQKEKIQAQKALSDKVIKDQESQLAKKEATLKDMLNDSENLHSHKAQLHAELERYKKLLPEAESLLQEVNKRHQMTQRELDNMTIEHEKEFQNNERLTIELTNEKHRYEDL